ncbi:hypothetical protein CCH79_00015796, partial [Gambusia affinis]
VIGGLVWILVASTRVVPENPLGWVMFVSIFCFVGTTLWLLIFACGGNQSSFWPGLDAGFHFVAAVFYLSASVVLAYVTIQIKTLSLSALDAEILKIYRLDISAVVRDVPCGYSPLLHPRHFLCHPMEESLKHNLNPSRLQTEGRRETSEGHRVGVT